MKIVHTITELRTHLAQFKHPAFVPTMGNLHEGHLALTAQAKPLGDVTVASIFVVLLKFEWVSYGHFCQPSAIFATRGL